MGVIASQVVSKWMKARRNVALMLNVWGHRTWDSLFFHLILLFSGICLSLFQSLMLLHGNELIPPYLALFKFGTLPALDSFLCLANISETSEVSHLSICLTFALIVHFVIERICEKDLNGCLLETFKTCTGLVFVEPDGEVVHGPFWRNAVKGWWICAISNETRNPNFLVKSLDF